MLTSSTCFEISKNPTRRSVQVDFNLELIKYASGLLAPPTGRERFLSVGSGHFVAGCRAINSGCRTPEARLADEAGKINSARVWDKQPVFKQLCKIGWEWTAIPSEVEERWPNLPRMAQRALNATNSVSSDTSELETAKTIAQYADQNSSNAWDMCVQGAATSNPPCVAYIDVIGKYAKLFGGGVGTCMVTYLDTCAKMYAENRKLGGDFFKAVVEVKYRDEKRLYPHVRNAMMATNLICDRVEDGVAEFLMPTHVTKTASKLLEPALSECEDILTTQWNFIKSFVDSGQLAQTEGYRLFGGLSARAVMHMLNLGKKGFEKKQYDDLSSIVEIFVEDVVKGTGGVVKPKAPRAATPAHVASSDDIENPAWTATDLVPTWAESYVSDHGRHRRRLPPHRAKHGHG